MCHPHIQQRVFWVCGASVKQITSRKLFTLESWGPYMTLSLLFFHIFHLFLFLRDWCLYTDGVGVNRLIMCQIFWNFQNGLTSSAYFIVRELVEWKLRLWGKHCEETLKNTNTQDTFLIKFRIFRDDHKYKSKKIITFNCTHGANDLRNSEKKTKKIRFNVQDNFAYMHGKTEQSSVVHHSSNSWNMMY